MSGNGRVDMMEREGIIGPVVKEGKYEPWSCGLIVSDEYCILPVKTAPCSINLVFPKYKSARKLRKDSRKSSGKPGEHKHT